MKTSRVWFTAVLLVAICAGVAAASYGGATATVVRASVTKSGGRQGTHTSSHIVLLSNLLVSGANERGTLVISNKTGRPIVWKCAYLEVQLTNTQWPLEVHPTPCGPNRTLQVGTTRFRFTLWASHSAGTTMKPLPPGKYHTQLLVGLPVAHPAPLAVHVVAKANP